MADYTASVKVKLQDQFTRSAKAVSKSAQRVNKTTVSALNKTKRVGQATVKTFDRVRKSSDKATKSLKKMRSLRMPGGALGGLASGAILAMEARRVATLEERYGRLAIQAEVTDAQMLKMRTNLEQTARNINIAPTELLNALDQIVEKTGDLNFATKQLDNMAKSVQATGATGLDIGATFAEFQKMGVTDPNEIKKMIDTLILQGKGGSFTLQEFAAQSSKLFPSITAYGFKGEKSIEQLGAVAQIARMGTGSADEATTSINSLLKTLSVKEDKLNNSGIKTKNEDGSLRDITSVVEDLIKLTNGNVGKLNEFFGDEGYKAIKYLIDGYKTTGDVTAYDKYTSIKGTGRKLELDATRASKFTNSKAQSLINVKDKYSDKVGNFAIDKANVLVNEVTGEASKNRFLEDMKKAEKRLEEKNRKIQELKNNTRIESELFYKKIAEKQQIEIKLKKSPDLKVDRITTSSSNIGIIAEDI